MFHFFQISPKNLTFFVNSCGNDSVFTKTKFCERVPSRRQNNFWTRMYCHGANLLRFINLSCSINNILSVVVLCCSFLAVIFFRPKNSKNLWVTSFSGLVINTLKLVVRGPMHYTIYGIANVLLYVDFQYIKNVG